MTKNVASECVANSVDPSQMSHFVCSDLLVQIFKVNMLLKTQALQNPP